MAKGDSVVSWKSGNTKILKVKGKSNGTCKLAAQKKTGKATLTVRLKSGIQKKITVKVQKTPVKTSRITGLNKSLTLKKGRQVTLKPYPNCHLLLCRRLPLYNFKFKDCICDFQRKAESQKAWEGKDYCEIRFKESNSYGNSKKINREIALSCHQQQCSNNCLVHPPGAVESC